MRELLDPSLLGLLARSEGVAGVAGNPGFVWLPEAVGALAFRAIQLTIVKDAAAGLG